MQKSEVITVSGREINELLSGGESGGFRNKDCPVPAGMIADVKEQRRRRRMAFMKFGAIGVITVIIMVFAALSWFTSSTEVETNGLGHKAQGMPYTILTRSASGYYKDKWEKTSQQAMEWKISQANNFSNYGEDLNPDDPKPGLEPGSRGTLEFRVEPNASDSITVDCVFDLKAYLETPVLDENDEPMLDENNEPVTEITEITSDTALLGYVKAHIMLFSGYENEKYTGLISTDEDLRRVLANQTYRKNETDYTTIYWVWPEYLEYLTSRDNTIFDPAERAKVISYIAANREGFFKDCGETEQKVITDLTALSQEYDGTVYNRYNMKYDSADLEIGNGISYVMLSMNVEQ